MDDFSKGRRFPNDSIMIVGNAQIMKDNPINHQFNGFFISFVVNERSGAVLDCSTSVVLPLTDQFIRDLFIDRRLSEDESDIVADINRRYYGSSRKAIIVAYKDAIKKFREIGN